MPDVEISAFEDYVPSETVRIQMEVLKLGLRAENLSRSGDRGAADAHAAYISARTKAEDAGMMMRGIEIADLRDRHHAFLPPDARVEVGVGWRQLVDAALDRLSHMQVVVTVIKEKFGALHISVWPREAWRAEDFDAVGPAKAPAIEASITVCEACGGPGTLFKDGRWRTRCTAHVEL